MRKLIGATLILAGCAGQSPKPKPMDGNRFGKDLAALKVAASPTIFRQAYRDASFELLQCQCYGELDQLLQELARTDPFETLCTPSSIVWRMRELRKYPSEFPWLRYHAEAWRKSTHGPYAQFAVANGYISHGFDLEIAWSSAPIDPLKEQATSIYNAGVAEASKVKESEPAGPSCLVLAKTVNDRAEVTLAEISKHPTDIGLYEILQYQLFRNNYDNAKKTLKSLAASSPSNYALFYTVQLPGNPARNTIKNGWIWEPLDKGFQSLLKDHPNALGLRNAYAVAARYFEKPEIQREQLAQLGYLIDLNYWGGLDQYQRDLGDLPDYRQCESSLAPLALGDCLRKNATLELSQLQAGNLFHMQQWAALDSELSALSPAQLLVAEEYLQQPKVNFGLREKQLKAWKEARPDSLAATASLGGFYVHYGWQARGTGTAESVSSEGSRKFHERLKIARDLLFQAYGANYQSPATMANLMTIYNAETNNRDSAQKLALQAAQKGLAGAPALGSYATMLLPRWRGKPGDIPKACDDLRKKTGNDDAYAMMLPTVIEQEGLDILNRDHPMHMDWKRALNSLLAGERSKRLSGRLAYYYLYLAECGGWRQDAAKILPYVPSHGGPLGDEPFFNYPARRAWAQGRAERLKFRPRFTYKSLGPHRQKAGLKAKVGFAVHLNHPFPQAHQYVVEVECPETEPAQGRPYSQPYTHYQLVAELDPMTQSDIELAAWPAPGGKYLPGTYKLSLWDLDDRDKRTVFHSETFELTDQN
jgi:hypothetical protein